MFACSPVRWRTRDIRDDRFTSRGPPPASTRHPGPRQGSTQESDLEAFEARGMEQLMRLKPTAGQALGIVPSKEAVDSVLVFRKAVRPEIEAHQLARRPQLVFDEWQSHFGRTGLAQPLERERLRLLECLDECTRQPRMLIGERLSDTERVHHPKQLCARIPI